jgi:hypothetical protein
MAGNVSSNWQGGYSRRSRPDGLSSDPFPLGVGMDRRKMRRCGYHARGRRLVVPAILVI